MTLVVPDCFRWWDNWPWDNGCSPTLQHKGGISLCLPEEWAAWHLWCAKTSHQHCCLPKKMNPFSLRGRDMELMVRGQGAISGCCRWHRSACDHTSWPWPYPLRLHRALRSCKIGGWKALQQVFGLKVPRWVLCLSKDPGKRFSHQGWEQREGRGEAGEGRPSSQGAEEETKGSISWQKGSTLCFIKLVWV